MGSVTTNVDNDTKVYVCGGEQQHVEKRNRTNCRKEGERDNMKFPLCCNSSFQLNKGNTVLHFNGDDRRTNRQTDG